MMKQIIACVDGSSHAQNVVTMAAWAAGKTDANIALLHVVAPHTEAVAPGDLSGQIGLGAKSDLLEDLAKIDEEHGKLEQRKGQLILEHTQKALADGGASITSLLHRRGDLLEEIQALEANAGLIIIGKRGETAGDDRGHLGANLERVSSGVYKPLLIATQQSTVPRRFLIAYDGRTNSDKAVDFACNSSLLVGLDCHVLKVGTQNSLSDAIVRKARDKLKDVGFDVTASVIEAPSVEAAVKDYTAENDIELLLMGAYGHSPLRRLFLGSTTMAQIEQSKVPVLLFR